jgi:hypothetical protein
MDGGGEAPEVMEPLLPPAPPQEALPQDCHPPRGPDVDAKAEAGGCVQQARPKVTVLLGGMCSSRGDSPAARNPCSGRAYVGLAGAATARRPSCSED